MIRFTPSMRFASVALALVCLSSLPAVAHGQRRTAALFGWIRDSSGAPIAHADVEIPAVHALAETDSVGAFLLRALDPGPVSVSIRRMGYSPQTFSFSLTGSGTDSVAVTMQVNAQVLEAMESKATIARRLADLQGFYERRARGPGYFLDRDEIMAHQTNLLSEALREVPGLHLVHNRGHGQDIRFESANSKSYNCAPDYWVDGQHVRGAQIDDYPASDVEAIELYAGPASAPMRFSQDVLATCGTVVIWTRVPGEP